MIVQDNTPSVGYISWSNVKIAYKGQVYNIADGYTNLPFVYWKYSDPNYFYASSSYPTWLTDDDLLVFLNKNGIHLTVPNTTIIDGSLIVPESILTNALAANSITSEKIAAGAITASKIAADAVGAEAIAAGAVLAEHINVDNLSAISANLGNVTAGSITSNTTIDVVTDASVGRRLVLKYNSTQPSELVFPNQWNEEYWKIYKSPDTEALVIQGRELNLNCNYNNYIFFGNQAETAYKSDYSSDSNYSYDTAGFYTLAKEKGYCGVGGMSAVATSGAVAGVGVNFRMRRFYTPSSVSFSQISATASPHAADITQDGFWLYVVGDGVQGSYRYWRGYYIVS